MLRTLTRFSTVFIVAALLTVTSTGCQPEGVEVDVAQGLSTSDLLKQDLQMVVDNGQMGSEMGSIENNLFKLKESDAALAEELTADLQELQSLQGSAAVSKAQSMIEKL
ncbi:MAG: hypothetical protein ISQ70_13850 [Pirellulales bacterium]|nr:hypothetical protein [Pirellulales bacterium]MBL7194601.1 hypothetical protein [Pirellulales bacterium]